MRVSTFFAATLPQAMAQVREALGPKAVVLSWRNTRGGVEISASVQEEDVAPKPQPAAQKRDDLLANHFAPEDFLPAPTQVPYPPIKPSRGLGALINRQPSMPKPAPRSPALEREGPGVRGLAGQKLNSNFSAGGKPPLTLTPLPREQEVRGALQKQSSLATFLVRAGLTLVQAQAFATSTTPELRRALSESIARALIFDPIAAIPNKPLILVGPPGSGKSTCAAKLAARTIASGHEVLLISADSERCGGADQLAALALRLGVRFDTVTTLTDLNALVCDARNRGIVAFIDAASACPAQPADMRATARMIKETNLEAIVCLPADMRSDDLEDLACAYQALGVKRAIATRLDLTTRRASILYCLQIAKIALAQISATPYISGGVAIATAARVASLVLEPFEDALLVDNSAADAA